MSKSILLEKEASPSRWIPTPAMAVKIAVCYALLGGLWILCSGWVLHYFVRDVKLQSFWEDIKGWFFVSATAALLWLALARYFQEFRRSAQLLRQSEARYRLLAENVEDFVSLFDAQGNRLYISPSFFRVTGWTPEEVMQSAWDARLHPDDIPAIKQSRAANLAGQTTLIEHRIRCRDNSWMWVEARCKPILGPDGTVIQLLNWQHDITARKRAEEALRQREAESRAMFDLASIGIAQADPRTGQWLRVNQKMCAITGYSAEEMLRMRVPAVTHPEDRERDWELFQSVARGDAPDYNLEKRYIRKDGSIAWVNVNMSVIRDAAGRPLRTMAAIEDITERKHLETQFRQAQKLEAVGQLAGGVAHDFNNILAAIMMHLGLLQMNPGLDQETRHALKELDEQARRAAGLTRQLLMFSRRSVLAVKPLDLNEVVANLLQMLRRLIGENIDLRFDGKGTLPLVAADAGMLEQVLMNLTVNARDAMPKGGRITISTSLADVGTAPDAANPNCHPGRFVCLTVSDAGCGMDAATLKRLFEPFFTTKEAGKGTGLGLATVHGIVAQHKGWVEVDSQVGQGSTFRVYLPAVAESHSEAPQTPQTEHVRRGKETILLVEDELPVRRVVGQSLRALGYQVYEAGNGQEAMTLWQLHGAQVDLVLADMVMPEGMTGLELAEQLQALKPGLKVIISSGYSAEIVQAGVPAKAGIVYLPKPYATKVLADVIRDCLDQKKSG